VCVPDFALSGSGTQIPDPDHVETGSPSGRGLARGSLYWVGERSKPMTTIRDWLFPVSLFAAWTITTAYTLSIISTGIIA
jgi:hypothetical protein